MSKAKKGKKCLTDLLFESVQKEDFEKLEQLLSENPSYNLNRTDTRKNKGGRTLMIQACRKGNLEIVSLLFENGASLKKELLDETTPFIAAYKAKQFGIVKFLISQEAISPPLPVQNTLLYESCEKNDLKTVKELVERGEFVNQPVKNAWTPLSIACQNQNYEIVTYLIENGADVNWYTEEKKLYPSSSSSPFLISVTKSDPKIVQYLVDHGASPSLIKLSLRFACKAGNLENVKILVETGTDFTARERRDSLSAACEIGHCDIAAFLLGRFEELKLNSYFVARAISMKNIQKSLDFTKFLISKGCAINGAYTTLVVYKAVIKTATPLCHACESGVVEKVALLLENGATVVSDNINAFHQCCKSKSVKCAELLLKYGADINGVIQEDARKRKTPLMSAASQQLNSEMIYFLVRNGARVGEVDDWGETALQYAVRARSFVNAKVLTEMGLDPFEKPKQFGGESPFHLSNWRKSRIQEFFRTFNRVDGSIKPAKREKEEKEEKEEGEEGEEGEEERGEEEEEEKREEEEEKEEEKKGEEEEKEEEGESKKRKEREMIVDEDSGSLETKKPKIN